MEDEIRSWFLSHDAGDNDFYVAAREDTFSVIPPQTDTEVILYSTKSHCLLNLAYGCGGKPPFAAVMRCGLPSAEDMSWLVSLVGTRRLVFFGDTDPVDLLIFARLRESLPIEYSGLSDRLLDRCGVALQDHLAMQLAPAESAPLPLVKKHLGDLTDWLGVGCSSLLSSGRKIEVEALFSYATASPEAMADALLM